MRKTLTGGGAALAALGATLALLSAGNDGAPAAAPPPSTVAASSAATPGTPVTTTAPPAPVAAPPTTPAPGPTSAPAEPPAPHIMNFAQGTALPTRQLPPQSGSTPVAPDADGCQHAYGAVNQCVPRSYPAGVADTPAAHCTWLIAHGYADLAVHGADPGGLDGNHDGVACGPGDPGVTH
ncbi:hypothetical protein [Kitasatospora sp. MMS16-BH015]|uniref:hypothetical protein n=1 Tax=Kitasatospora sp. MMS16-BH015 TaxID=2018025 RepID=UPI000CF1F395|nr:hypothetical protein [Kitasatospora sp. MMS16-BH015]